MAGTTNKLVTDNIFSNSNYMVPIRFHPISKLVQFNGKNPLTLYYIYA